jgi:hypothetical protein
MKKLHFFKVSLILLLFIFMASCSKETINQNNSTEAERSAKVQELTDRIVDFYKRVNPDRDEPNFRDEGTNLTVEEGVWGIEALMNIYFSRANIAVDEISTSEVTFSVPVVDNTISNEDLTNAYVTAWQDLLNNYNSRDWVNKQTIFVDLTIESATSTEAQIRATSVIGKVTEGETTIMSPDCDQIGPVFFEGDDWLAGYAAGEGKCDGTILESNAAEELEKKLNYYYPLAHPIVSPNPYEPYHVGFIEIQTIWDIDPVVNELLNESDNVQWDNNRDYLMYTTSDFYPNYHTPDCLDYNDMNWYYCKMWGIIDVMLPTGREFISVDVEADAWFPAGSTTRVHTMDLYHGIPLFVSDIDDGNPGSGPFIESVELTEIILSIE